jgi:cystathionine beta-synthase
MPVQILDTALSAVGHTPLIRLDKIARAQGLKCNLRTFISFLAALSEVS